MTLWFAILATLVAGVIGFTYLPPLVLRSAQRRRMRRLFRNRIAFTFDDGPDAITTPLLLDVLRRHNVTASFFLVGFRADRHPEVADQIVAAGHEVGCHSYWHRNFWRHWPWVGVSDLRQAYATGARWMPSDAPYRPPRGKLTGWQWWVLRRRGSKPVWWTRVVGDTLDPLPNVDQACRAVIESRGGVLLLHCHHKEPARRAFVLEFIDQLLRAAVESRIEVVPLLRVLNGDALSASSPVPGSGAA